MAPGVYSDRSPFIPLYSGRVVFTDAPLSHLPISLPRHTIESHLALCYSYNFDVPPSQLRRVNSEIHMLHLAMYINHPGYFNTSSPSATSPTQSVSQPAERHPYPICIYTRCLSPRASLSPSSIYQKSPMSNQPRGNISENTLRCGPPSVVSYTSTTRRVDFPLRLNQEGPHLKGSR